MHLKILNLAVKMLFNIKSMNQYIEFYSFHCNVKMNLIFTLSLSDG